MNNSSGYILVLWDSTIEAENSFKHALLLAKKSNFDLIVTKFFRKKALFESRDEYEKEISAEKAGLSEDVKKMEIAYGKKPEVITMQGNFKASVKQILEEKECVLLVTPEQITIPKGEKINILNEFSRYGEIEIPIIIANSAPREEHASLEVVVPMEYRSEFKDTIDTVILFSKKYSCNFDFIKPAPGDNYPMKELINNIYFTKEVLDYNEIVYGIKTANKFKSFIDDIYDFANSIDANYIMSTTLNYNSYKKNPLFAEIPFICINPRKRKYRNFN